MEPKFQTSFIPKKPVSSAPQIMTGKVPPNLFYIISVIVFVAVVLLCIGLFSYKIILKKQIDTANTEITKTRADFQPDTIAELLNHNNRILFATRILNNHVILYPMFSELQNLTLKNVSFSNFTYLNSGGVISLSSDVVAKNYNALAQQSLAFTNSKYISNSVFSGFGLTDEGSISAKFMLNLNSSLVSYKQNMESSKVNQ